jgi:hypothetical protein
MSADVFGNSPAMTHQEMVTHGFLDEEGNLTDLGRLRLDRDHHTPRLLSLLCWQGCLSHREAEVCLEGYRQGDEYCCEAVAHYGGATALIKDAVRNRHLHMEVMRAHYYARWGREG